jgi:mRNA interferase MazF
MKDYKSWHEQKSQIEHKKSHVFFKEKEIWWTRIGLNIGSEQDGVGNLFVRPILILKKINQHTFIGLPLTTQNKKIETHYSLEKIPCLAAESYVMCEQIRILSSKRFLRKMGKLPSELFFSIQKKSADFLRNLPRSRIKR